MLHRFVSRAAVHALKCNNGEKLRFCAKSQATDSLQNILECRVCTKAPARAFHSSSITFGRKPKSQLAEQTEELEPLHLNEILAESAVFEEVSSTSSRMQGSNKYRGSRDFRSQNRTDREKHELVNESDDVSYHGEMDSTQGEEERRGNNFQRERQRRISDQNKTELGRNVVELIGRTNTPITSKNGRVVVFDVYTNDSYRHPDTNEQMVTSIRHRIKVTTPKMKEITLDRITAGTRVFVLGRLAYRNITYGDGEDKRQIAVASIIAEQIFTFSYPSGSKEKNPWFERPSKEEQDEER